jgi:hypothetical protein
MLCNRKIIKLNFLVCYDACRLHFGFSWLSFWPSFLLAFLLAFHIAQDLAHGWAKIYYIDIYIYIHIALIRCPQLIQLILARPVLASSKIAVTGNMQYAARRLPQLSTIKACTLNPSCVHSNRKGTTEHANNTSVFDTASDEDWIGKVVLKWQVLEIERMAEHFPPAAAYASDLSCGYRPKYACIAFQANGSLACFPSRCKPCANHDSQTIIGSLILQLPRVP